ncbi:MAG TPA: ROK family protein [Pseudomonadales bacterium]|nr:ROK family protein [Pseudomonadales bacterium]
MFGAIEAGGTKFNCALANAEGVVVAKTQFPTRDPDTTLIDVVEFFLRAEKEHGAMVSLGIGSFGPINIDPSSATYGQFLKTPKPGWSHFDFLGSLKQSFNIPVIVETDVNTAVIAEHAAGAGQGCDNVVYVTIGTGIGGGIISGGQLVKGGIHPEVGHMLLPRHPEDSDFPGACPFHGGCLEGLAAGPSMKARWGVPAETLGDDHIAWDIQAFYLAAMCVNLTSTLSPQKIILGGGVSQKPGLIERVAEQFENMWGDYLPLPGSGAAIDYIVLPQLAPEAGLVGAIMLAQQAVK